ncbi:DNA-deoxyinosine glycosylase [Acetobacterium bakii]|uniref:DNA glycosylase n=1 Tax=Acetobacterium bakii TaxID=52689 RepID=A0A0L6U4R0_9FIRM|nr:DNA-deoxyinosine glycosylase [Acetobacterium bakii]KNZ43501.1 DNA glycosylase [Acetobacterium bakii]
MIVKKEKINILIHKFEPVYNEKSKILILGTFPSVKSRTASFYYQHPQNRFWKVISALIGMPTPETIAAERKMLLSNHIAVWDVIYSCDINGSSDSSIRNVVPNDIAKILKETDIKTIYANGGKAYELYNRYCYEKTNEKIIRLPSTSPANAQYSLERLIECWQTEIKIES